MVPGITKKIMKKIYKKHKDKRSSADLTERELKDLNKTSEASA